MRRILLAIQPRAETRGDGGRAARARRGQQAWDQRQEAVATVTVEVGRGGAKGAEQERPTVGVGERILGEGGESVLGLGDDGGVAKSEEGRDIGGEGGDWEGRDDGEGLAAAGGIAAGKHGPECARPLLGGDGAGGGAGGGIETRPVAAEDIHGGGALTFAGDGEKLIDECSGFGG